MRFRMCSSIALICALAGSLCAQNLVQNGTFDDDSAWTVIEHTVPAVTTIDLGYVDDAPALGAAPCLRIASAGNDVSRPVVYQKITLIAGQEYMISSAIKLLDATPASPAGTWFQIYMSPEEPYKMGEETPNGVVGEVTVDWNPPHKIFNIDAWAVNIADFIGFDGLFADGSLSFQVGDGTGLYIPPGEAGAEVDIFLAIKPGQCCRVGSYEVLFDNVSVTPVGVAEPLAVPMTSVAPVIDGELDGVWHNVAEQRCLINDIINADSAMPESWLDLFGTFKVMADANNIYMFIEVQDSVLPFEFSTWNGDGVEICFDGDNSKGETYDGVNDTQIRITVDDVELADIDSAISKEGTVFKVLLTDLGYNVEASFPLDVLQISPDNVFGFEVQINDNDGGGRETMSRWHSDDNDSWQNASLFGQAQLVNRTIGDVLDVAKVGVAPVIDGVMETDWEALPEITGNTYSATGSDFSKQDDYTDARFSFRVAWDDANLYFFISVLDDMYYDLAANHTADGIELFFDADNSKTFEAYDQVDDVQLRINHAEISADGIDISGGTRAPANVTKDNINFAIVDTAFGYDMEFAIPLIDLAIPAEIGHVFGFEIGLNDADEDVRDNIRKYWNASNDSWKFANLFGEAVLVGGEEATGLVAHWKFDDGASNTATDSVGNAHPGTIGGTANWVTGQVGGALDFDGSTNYVDIQGDNPIISGTFSLTMWVYARNIPFATDNRMPLSNDSWVDGAIHVHIMPETSIFKIDTKNGTDISSNAVFQADQWYHVAGTLDAAGESKIYINGVLDNSATGKSKEYFIGPANIGAYQNNSRFFDGMIDDVRIYNRVLPEVEILELAGQ